MTDFNEMPTAVEVFYLKDKRKSDVSAPSTGNSNTGTEHEKKDEEEGFLQKLCPFVVIGMM